jgi:uridine kinase
VPAGLDGCPNPLVTPERDRVLDAVADLVREQGAARKLVGVDGRSGAGKSTFADELAGRLASGGLATVRSTTDSFHRPRAERLARGATSGDGYYLDSHQLGVVVDELLVPFAAGAPEVRTAAFDEPSDAAVTTVEAVGPVAVLVFDGLFLQRPELDDHWDVTVFLDAEVRRERAWVTFLLDDLPDDVVDRAATLDARLASAHWPRYRDGWRAYVEAVDPRAAASVVVDNNDIGAPRIVGPG